MLLITFQNPGNLCGYTQLMLIKLCCYILSLPVKLYCFILTFTFNLCCYVHSFTVKLYCYIHTFLVNAALFPFMLLHSQTSSQLILFHKLSFRVVLCGCITSVPDYVFCYIQFHKTSIYVVTYNFFLSIYMTTYNNSLSFYNPIYTLIHCQFMRPNK